MDGQREEMVEELEALRKENTEMKSKIALYEKCDPKRLEEISSNKKLCH